MSSFHLAGPKLYLMTLIITIEVSFCQATRFFHYDMIFFSLTTSSPSDGDDEFACPDCMGGEIACPQGGGCIPANATCDGIINCPDGWVSFT